MRKRMMRIGVLVAFTIAAANERVVGAAPEIEGEWSPLTEWNFQAVHMILLRDGNVLLVRFGFANRPYNPGADCLTSFAPPSPANEYNLFCSGHTQLADGRVVFVGGGLSDEDAHPHTVVFDPGAIPPGPCQAPVNPWTIVNDMPPFCEGSLPPGQEPGKRWYPTCTTLSDGRVLVLGGDIRDASCHTADTPLIFDPEPTDPVLPQYSSVASADLHWPYYPFTFMLTDGRIAVAGSHYFHSGPPADPYWSRTLTLFGQAPPAPPVGKWDDIAVTDIKGGSAAMIRPDLILKAGGGTQGIQGPDCNDVDPTNRAFLLQKKGKTLFWTEVAPMNFARYHFYLVLLPDGKVLAVGGFKGQGPTVPQQTCDDAVLTPEIYDPDTNQWRMMDNMDEHRLYHSSAVLLPDARVLVAGGQHPDTQTTAQIFSPPYLFQGPGSRPAIVTSPAEIEYGKSFTLTTDMPVDDACLMGLGAATHSFDQNQRYVPLDVTAAGQGNNYMVAPPAHAYLAPPGYYMLFALANGVPSQANMVKLR